MPEVFVGRQPIYTRKLDVFAYELLFRNTATAEFAGYEDADQATSQVILNAFLEIGAERVVGNRLAFLNLTRGFIVGEYPLPVPSEQVVIEVLEDIEPDAEVLKGLRRLKDQGFRIALDDYEHREELVPLLELADIVKVDCLALGLTRVREQLEILKRFDVQLLAEKVESFEEFEDYQDLGFEYFQGYFLSRPKVVRGRRIPANRLGVLRLLSRLYDPTADIEELEELISQDVTLSFNLLRHVNSATYSLPRRIEQVGETIIILGADRVRSLASLLLLSGVDDKPSELIVTALLRAKMCEALAERVGLANTAPFFTTGLFSTLDAMMDAPLPVVLRQLPLAEEIRSALLYRGGVIGSALRCVLAYERGEWGAASFPGVEPSGVKGAFLEAVDWAGGIERGLDQAA